jgi:type II secretory pathway component PulC
MLAALLLAASVGSAPPDLTLTGLVVSARPEACVAILRAGDRSRVVGVGDTAFGGRVEAITSTGVVLSFADDRRELRMGPAPDMMAGASPAVAPLAAGPAAAPGERSLPRGDVQRRLGEEIPRILAETTLVPVADGAHTVGFSLARIPEGTLLTDAGLRAGDVLTHLNDVPIDSLPTLIGLWPRLQGATTVRAQVLRNGQPLSLTVTLR